MSEDTGLVDIGGDLSVETLLSAYSRGIFPWPQPGFPMLWFCPPQRGVIDFAELHVARSLKKELGRGHEITFDTAFESVIRACAEVPRSHESGTWILPEMISAYIEFHRAGHAHSCELWENVDDGAGGSRRELVGGMYGVFVRGVFSGESMFFRRDNASKICLLAMISRLQSAGVSWIDTQMVTPVVEQLGGKYISREVFLERLRLRNAKLVIDWSAPFEGFLK